MPILRIEGRWRTQCEYDGCEVLVPQGQAERLGKWHKLKATKELGWFIQKDNTAWCPDHVPEWVEAWRARKDSK